MKIIPFKKEHLECMDMRDHEKDFVDIEDMSVFEGCAITGILDGRIISCGGMLIEKYGCAYVWQVPSIYVSSVQKSYCRVVKEWLDSKIEEYMIHRLESVCLNDDLHNRWMLFLGFEKEGIKKSYYNGQDFAMFGRVIQHGN